MSKSKWERVPIQKRSDAKKRKRPNFTAKDKEQFDRAYDAFWRKRGMTPPSGEFPEFGNKDKREEQCG